MTNLVRQLKLHALVGEKASTDARVGLIVAFFAELFKDMEYSNIPAYDEDSVILHKGETFYMEQDLENNSLWCRYDGFWSYLQTDLGLSHDETRVVVKIMVEKHLEYLVRVGTPITIIGDLQFKVEKHLKQHLAS